MLERFRFDLHLSMGARGIQTAPGASRLLGHEEQFATIVVTMAQRTTPS